MSTQKKYNVGETIKKARKEIGLSQKEFAQVLHVSDKTVSSYEVGRALPSFEMMKKISKSLHKPITYFDDDAPEDLDLQLRLNTIERELLEIKKLLKQRRVK
jgi:repressor LexA